MSTGLLHPLQTPGERFIATACRNRQPQLGYLLARKNESGAIQLIEKGKA